MALTAAPLNAGVILVVTVWLPLAVVFLFPPRPSLLPPGISVPASISVLGDNSALKGFNPIEKEIAITSSPFQACFIDIQMCRLRADRSELHVPFAAKTAAVCSGRVGTPARGDRGCRN